MEEGWVQAFHVETLTHISKRGGSVAAEETIYRYNWLVKEENLKLAVLHIQKDLPIHVSLRTLSLQWKPV